MTEGYRFLIKSNILLKFKITGFHDSAGSYMYGKKTKTKYYESKHKKKFIFHKTQKSGVDVVNSS